MLELVSVKGDARPERQSSWLSSLRTARQWFAGQARPLQLSFAGFVLWHFCVQAYRAGTAGALPEAGFERTPWFVGGLLVLLWLPFTALGVRKVCRSFAPGSLKALKGQARALAVVEPLGLAIVLAFGGLHGGLMAAPLLTGTLDASDLRAELVAGLSSTWRGFPLQGAVYLCAVGAAAFCAARLTLALLPAGRSWLTRAVLSLAVLSYLLGSYAVIRCGSGSLFP
jgi:hypothetical protein